MSETSEGRTIDLSIEVPGTPEEVWETIATGPGIASWFIPMQIEERLGGEVLMDFGEFGKDTATVTAWDPPRRVVFQSGGERPLAYEWLVEGCDGGTCVVRLVNSGFRADDEFDADFDGMSEGWKIFFANLRLHLTHFRGQRARPIIPTVLATGRRDAVWSSLCEGLGVSPTLTEGERLVTSGEGVPRLAGTVEDATRTEMVSEYLLLLDEPAPGTAFIAVEGNASPDVDKVAASLYLYLYGPEGEAVVDDWTGWLRSRFGGG